MPLDFNIQDDIDWDSLAPSNGQIRRVLRKVGSRLATRLRQRRSTTTRDSKGRFKQGALRQTGQLAKSLKSRLRRNENTVVVGFSGIRKDSDTHKHRAPMSNFSIAAFLSAKGRDMLGLTETDNDWFVAEVERQIFALVQKESADADGED